MVPSGRTPGGVGFDSRGPRSFLFSQRGDFPQNRAIFRCFPAERTETDCVARLDWMRRHASYGAPGRRNDDQRRDEALPHFHLPFPHLLCGSRLPPSLPHLVAAPVVLQTELFLLTSRSLTTIRIQHTDVILWFSCVSLLFFLRGMHLIAVGAYRPLLHGDLEK